MLRSFIARPAAVRESHRIESAGPDDRVGGIGARWPFLAESQRYPGESDGIIAGDPANNWTRNYAGGHLWAARAMEGDGYIPAAKVPLIAEAVNNACDALDGIKDGVLNDPRRCHFDPAALLCKTGDTKSCLTNAQVEAVTKIWTGLRNSDGDQIYP